MMKIEDIVSAFKKHQLQYGLDGDSGLKELYKWELVAKQLGHPDTDAVDFANEINSVQLHNLCYPPQITAYRNFAKYAPEEYRMALRMLFTETVDLQERVDSFTSTCRALWDNKIKSHFEQNTSAMCDERLISCFLTLKYPQKYTFYKSDVYSSLCNILGVESKKAGYKLVHFYELLNKYVVPVVENDKELMDSISKEIDNKGFIHSTFLIAQTALWYYVCTSNTEKTNFVVSQDNDNNKTKDNPMKKYSEYIDLLKENHNLVLTGAPGTGKTFMAKAIAEEMGCGKDEMCFVQFHPSYDYTDFVEGLRPIEKSDGQVGFERKDGVFKEFCKKALKNIVDSKKSIESLSKELSWEEKLQDFIEDAIENNTKFTLSNKSEFSIEEIKGRVIIVHNEQNEKTNRIYVNADDIIQLLSNEVPLNYVRDIRTFFKRKFGSQPDSYAYIITKEIRKKKNNKVVLSSVNKINLKPFVFIIDEINRGEISKIFGELFFSIDPGYRGKKGKVKTQYQNMVSEGDVFADGFYVPDNVYIIGTMNDIDRSVESMDFAMRRRFTWIEISAESQKDMLDSLGEYAQEAKDSMTALNQVIEGTPELGKAYEIGPAYFLKLKNCNYDFDSLWEMNIEPLLREYLRGYRNGKDIIEKCKNAYDLKNKEGEQ